MEDIMKRRKIIIISSLVIVALAGAAFALSGKFHLENLGPDDSSYSVKQDDLIELEDYLSTYPVAENTEKSGIIPENSDNNGDGGIIELINFEEIKVINNSPEYDLKVLLSKNSNGEEFISLEYYYNGVSISKELSSRQVPEIKGIFDKRAGESADKTGFRVKTACLNTKYSKLYLIIEVAVKQDFVDTSMYVVNLKEFAPKKLFSGTGRYTDIFFSRDFKYLGYSYFDSPAGSACRENSLVNIVRCETDEFVVRDSRNIKGELIGNIKDLKNIYDLSFVSWDSDTVAKLKMTVNPKDGNKVESAKKEPKEVLYDIEKNTLLSLDGSLLLEEDKAPEKQETDRQQNESGSVATLKSFYSYLSSEEDYGKGLDLLDSEFTLEIGILQQFGIEVLTKKDIDLKSAPMYAEMLRLARLDTIVKEDSTESSSTIYYYQVFSLSEAGTELKQPLIAHLKKIDEKWTILEIKEDSEAESPFKK
jgi:hypothetical protein